MDQVRFRCAIIRSGTSKGIYMMKNELPSDPILRDKVVRAIFGSPDIRQIDGLGGAEPLTSKFAMIGPPTRAGHDCDYIFAQVDIPTSDIQWGGICGNISSGVGPFAIDEGLAEAKEPVTKVRINCPTLNPPRTLIAEVPVAEGKAKVEGTYSIDGVPGTGSKIGLNWAGLAGAKTGKLLPTGNVKDTLEVKGLGKIEFSFVDLAHVQPFARARDFGIKGTEGPKEFDSNEELLQRMYTARKAISAFADEHGFEYKEFMGFAIVAEPADFVDHTTGKTVKAEEVDFLSKILFMGKLHKAYPGSGAANTGVAAKIPGTVVNEVFRPEAMKRLEVRIGHPAGIMVMESEVEVGGPGDYQVKCSNVFRTVRRIMDGYVYVPKSIFNGK